MASRGPVEAQPWTGLAAFAEQLKQGALIRIMKAGMRKGMYEWRDKYIPLRFSHAAHSIYGFSNRSTPYAKRRIKNQKGVFKGSLPDYVYTGKFRDQLLVRKPKTKEAEVGAATVRFTIYGGAMNLLGQDKMRGYIAEVVSRQRITETVKQHTRRGRVVRSHQRTGFRKTWKTTMSPRTYRDEWELTRTERISAQNMVNNATRDILFSKTYWDPRTRRFKAKYLREELLK